MFDFEVHVHFLSHSIVFWRSEYSALPVCIVFEELDCLEQASLLNSMLLAFHCNNSNANLKLIKGSTAAGRIQVNKKLPDRSSASVFIVNQSPSGLWENKVRIN